MRPGKVNRVVVEFRGGGACWNAVTCFPDARLFEETATAEPWVADESKAVGIYDHSRDDNPFKDWHHVYIPVTHMQPIGCVLTTTSSNQMRLLWPPASSVVT
ncbi:MAG: hypothetical protein KJ015_12775 [Myxococcales bacterium]|nr:hypothetical protein [Myxococcales bacterium]